MKKKEKGIKEKFSEALELPKELLLNIPRITMLGNENMYIENYKGIIEYDENIIRMLCNINIYGSNLRIEEITTDEILIIGKINNLEFDG